MNEATAKEYTVLLEKGENNWSAYVPDLPGCMVTGKTRADTLALMREAIEFHIEGMRLNGEVIPEPKTDSERLAIAA